MAKKALGRGLDALIPQSAPPSHPDGRVVEERLKDIPTDRIDLNPHQPRKTFDEEKLKHLSNSIAEDGVLQPIVVRKRGDRFQLIMGERRFQASCMAGHTTVPAVIREDVKEVDALRLALVENIQREDLNAIDVAKAYRVLVGEYGLSQSDLADLVGKDRSSVANTLRLLNLPDDVHTMLVGGEISEGHARALLSLPTQKEQLELARKVVRNKLSVRQTEQEAGVSRPKKAGAARMAKEKPAQIQYLENELSSHLGTRVLINEKRGGKGSMTIEFYSHEEFERLASLMHLPIPR